MVTCVVACCFQYRKDSAFKVFFRPGKFNCMAILLIQTVSCYVHTLTVLESNNEPDEDFLHLFKVPFGEHTDELGLPQSYEIKKEFSYDSTKCLFPRHVPTL